MIIDPTEVIKFNGPSDHIRTAILKLTNDEKQDITAKIKTTGPNFYAIKPNGIKVKTGETRVFSISLYPGKYKLNGHKFILTVRISKAFII
jgi:hypothetical protein